MSKVYSYTNNIPHQSYWKIFTRFLKFGFLAWGGPIPQINMIRQEIVAKEGWISKDRFKRVLGVYQVLPGPEAHELCVYFGMIARGRIGGFLAGLGFMLPGFLLMFLLSWLYITFQITQTRFGAVFQGIQPAVIGLILVSGFRLAKNVLTEYWLWAIVPFAFLVDYRGMHFVPTLIVAGIVYVLAKRKQYIFAVGIGLIFIIGTTFWTNSIQRSATLPQQETQASQITSKTAQQPLHTLFLSGLKSGLLTFGGAYTVIPFMQNEAVKEGKWMTNSQFVDGLALSGILPAPLIIFATFVGYIGGGWLGAIIMTFAIFLPAFLFTLVGHNALERLAENELLHNFFYGVTAGVMGIVAVTALELFQITIISWERLFIFIPAMLLLLFWRSRFTILVLIFLSGLTGFLLFGR